MLRKYLDSIKFVKKALSEYLTCVKTAEIGEINRALTNVNNHSARLTTSRQAASDGRRRMGSCVATGVEAEECGGILEWSSNQSRQSKFASIRESTPNRKNTKLAERRQPSSTHLRNYYQDDPGNDFNCLFGNDSESRST